MSNNELINSIHASQQLIAFAHEEDIELMHEYKKNKFNELKKDVWTHGKYD